jgi:aspartate-semialdehyde dehydrogenase
VIAVVSAFYGETDRLEGTALRVTGTPDPASVARLLATGEAVSAALLSVQLNAGGIPARVVDPHEIRLFARGPRLNASPVSVDRGAVDPGRCVMNGKTNVSVLGATGVVGQRLLMLLADHPWFEVADLVASGRSAGQRYGDAVRRVTPGRLPDRFAGTILRSPGEKLRGDIVFSTPDRGPAAELEPFYAVEGSRVVSNASAFRDDPRVPLVVPEVNPHAIEGVRAQPWAQSGGGIVTNPNCCVAGLVLALAPLHRAFGVESVAVVTLQALSGAGVPGVVSVEALGNVIPFIPGEAEKIAAEPCRILEAGFPVSVAVNRVPVTVGQIRTDPNYNVCFKVVVHNAVRGAAGAALLNAELLCAMLDPAVQSR